jgi:hypothetical protein
MSTVFGFGRVVMVWWKYPVVFVWLFGFRLGLAFGLGGQEHTHGCLSLLSLWMTIFLLFCSTRYLRLRGMARQA